MLSYDISILHVLYIHTQLSLISHTLFIGLNLKGRKGLAIIVTNDYRTSPSHCDIFRLGEMGEDRKAMEATFEGDLKYTTLKWENESAATISENLNNLEKICKEKEKREKLKLSDYHIIIFAYSGHGVHEDESEYILANDGEKLDVLEEIVLSITEVESIEKVQKLFLLDTCHRGQELEAFKSKVFVERDCMIPDAPKPRKKPVSSENKTEEEKKKEQEREPNHAL